jgi:uridine kinase
MKMINIHCVNTGCTHQVPMGSNLEQVYELLNLNMPYGCTSAKVNNKAEGLHFILFNDKDVEFLDITSASGRRTYTRSVFFVLYKAARDLFPDATLRIDTPVSNGYFCHLDLPGGITADQVVQLKERMQSIIDANIPFHRLTCHTTEAIDLFRKEGLENKAKLLEHCGRLYTHYYTLDNVANYFYGSLLVRTGQIYLFDLIPYGDGLLIRLPDPKEPSALRPVTPQPMMFDVFREQHRWQQIIGVSTIGELNEACSKGYTNDLINVSEALQEKRISRLADRITENPNLKVILIAGPSSSGKTTFSKRLGVQLRVRGYDPVLIALDDYFVDRDKTPLGEDGKPDFEALEAIDLATLNDHLSRLSEGQSVEIPRYDFISGKRQWHEKPLQLTDRSILILEGIHALNPRLTPGVADGQKFKIYISCFTSVAMDNFSRIPTTDNRMLRRTIRDNATRGNNALRTLAMWPSVRHGEERHIFPYQENADVMFNSSLFYEISVLRAIAEPLLLEVPDTVPEYADARRMLKFLDNFVPIAPDEIPPTSLLREFIGGSSFKY